MENFLRVVEQPAPSQEVANDQAFLTVKKNKKSFYCDYYVLGQTVEASNTLQDISSYTLKEKEVKMVRPQYNPETGKFKGLYETAGFLVVRGSPEEVFFNYGYDKEKSKTLFSHYRRKIPNSFSGTIFNGHRTMIESGEVESEMSNIFFFLHSITDRSEEINKYLNNVPVCPVDITQQQLNGWAKTSFDPSKLDTYGLEENMMTNAVIKCLKHMNDISSSNIIRNADGWLSRREVDAPVAWVGEHKQRLPPQKFKVSY